MSDPFAPPSEGADRWGPAAREVPQQAFSAPRWESGPGGEPDRHPLDPDVATSSRAGAVLLLGIAAVLMMFCVGGVIPAVLGLSIARGARAELAAAQGFLRGDAMLRNGVAMCWVAVGTTLLIVVVAVVGVLIWAGTGELPRFGDNVD